MEGTTLVSTAPSNRMGFSGLAAVRKHLFHLGAVFRRRPGAHRIHVGHKAYTSVLDAAEGDGGVAYING